VPGHPLWAALIEASGRMSYCPQRMAPGCETLRRVLPDVDGVTVLDSDAFYPRTWPEVEKSFAYDPAIIH